MRSRRTNGGFEGRASAGLCALALALGAAPGAAQQRDFALAGAIPDDFFLVTAERHNPERAFLDAYWAEVGQAFWDSGVTEQLAELVLTRVDPEARGELERIRERFGALCGAVDWSAFDGCETVFGERLRAPIVFGEGALSTQPDVALLFRLSGGDAQQTHQGLVGIVAASLDELERASGVALPLVELELHGARFACLEFAPDGEAGPSLPLSIGWREDVLIVTFGPGVREQVAALLAGEGAGHALVDTPHYRAARAAAPPPEDGFEYVDMHVLGRGVDAMLGGLIELAAHEVRGEAGDQIHNAGRDPRALALRREAYVPYQQGDYAGALAKNEAALEVDPGDSAVMFNLACLHALMGETDTALGWLDRAVEAGFHAPAQMRADPDLASLHGHPRYEEAVERAARAAAGDAGRWVAFARHLLDRGLGALAVLDAGLTVHHTDGRSVYSTSITTLASDATANPLHAVLAASRPVEDWARWLPRETTSFSATGGGGVEALYDWLLDSLASGGAAGEELLGHWSGLQQQLGCDVREDVLGWIDGECVRCSFALDGADAWVWRLRVSDEVRARAALERLLEVAPEKLSALAAGNPALAMLAPRVRPSAHEALGDFHEVAVGPMPQPVLCGVRGEWLILGSSAEAVLRTEATGAGEHPNVRQNEALMADALIADGPVTAVSFTDHTGDAETMAAVLTGVSSGGAMAAAWIPDAEVREVVMELLGMLGDLAPVVAAIDFYESSAACTTFDGKAWRERSVTHYRAPAAPDDSAHH